MQTVKTNVIGVFMMSAIVASCGGNNDQLVGVFSDSPVGGINFSTPTISGVTDADGSFRYRDGETVIFSIGNLALPAVLASEMVTPLDMGIEPDINDPSVVNIARLLQSLDEDGNPDNGILISEHAASAFPSLLITMLPTATPLRMRFTRSMEMAGPQ